MMINASKGRYYSTHDQQYDKCNNCDQMGHFHKNCPETQLIKCHYCLHSHKREECDLDYCFQCAKNGHRSSNCPHKYEKQCRRCFKRGHTESLCAVLLNYRGINNRRKDLQKDSLEFTRCMNCERLGHEQCYLKGNKIASQILRDGLYDRESMKVTAIELNLGDFIEDEDMHPKVIMSKNQRRRKLNELMHVEVEDMTVDVFNQFSRNEDNHKSNLDKRKPDRHNYSNTRGGYDYSNSYRGGRDGLYQSHRSLMKQNHIRRKYH